MSISVKHLTAASIRFDTKVVTIGGQSVLLVPEEESVKLSSRGQVCADVVINDSQPIQVVLEPDGRWSHWLRITDEMPVLAAGDTVSVHIVRRADWPEPVVPSDFKDALDEAPEDIKEMWRDITPMARWEWIRWVNSTREQGTRDRRVEVSILKMMSGKRRPCCFNLAACTDPELSRSGRLMPVD